MMGGLAPNIQVIWRSCGVEKYTARLCSDAGCGLSVRVPLLAV